MATHASEACCTTPVAVAEGYVPKGTYRTISETKCYTTGRNTAQKAIYVIYDIFGYTDQTLQGADLLALTGQGQYLVVVPDFFDGKPAQPGWLAGDTDEKTQQFNSFLAKLQDPQPYIQRVRKVLAAMKHEHQGIEKWGAIGCARSSSSCLIFSTR